MAHHKDLTGRDAYVIVEALTFTIEALSGLPAHLRPDNNIARQPYRGVKPRRFLRRIIVRKSPPKDPAPADWGCHGVGQPVV